MHPVYAAPRFSGGAAGARLLMAVRPNALQSSTLPTDICKDPPHSDSEVLAAMRRLLLAICGLLVITGLLVGCQPSEADVKKEKLDTAIHELEEQFAQYYLMGPDAPVADVQAGTKRLSAAWDEMKTAAEGVEGIDVSKATAAHDDLADTVEKLPAEAKDGDAMKVAVPKLEAFKAAVEQVHESGDFKQ